MHITFIKQCVVIIAVNICTQYYYIMLTVSTYYFYARIQYTILYVLLRLTHEPLNWRKHVNLYLYKDQKKKRCRIQLAFERPKYIVGAIG